VYQVQNSSAVARAGRILLAPRRAGVSRTVLVLGVTSLLTDISSEMVSTILPLYLVYTVGLSPVQFGVVDGTYQGGAAIARLISGFFADRLRRHKEVAFVGYALSAVCKPLMVAAGSAWGVLGTIVFVDRTGKGIRTAPRDALISLTTVPERLGTSFGVHRAMDTVGAMLGPLLAFGILMLVPNGFNSVFVASFAFAIIGVTVLALFVQNPKRPAGTAPDAPPLSLREASGLLGRSRFTLVTVGAALLAFFTISDGFVYLDLQRRLDLDIGFFPLLYMGTAIVYMLLAAPAGAIGDRIGRGKVFVCGYGLLLAMYALLFAGPSSGFVVVAVLALFGVYYATTDGVLAAMASAVVPAELRATGLSLLAGVSSLAKLASSIVFGALWASGNIHDAVGVFAVGLACVIPIAAMLVSTWRRSHAIA
jgi:MFS family permease